MFAKSAQREKRLKQKFLEERQLLQALFNDVDHLIAIGALNDVSFQAGAAPARASAPTSGKVSEPGARAAFDTAPTGEARPLRASRALVGLAWGSLMPFLRVRRRPWRGPALRPDAAAGWAGGDAGTRPSGGRSRSSRVFRPLRWTATNRATP